MSGDGGSPGQQPYGQGPGGYGQPGWGGPGGWGPQPGWGYQPLAPKPGVIPLRPLSFGEMFSAVFDTLRRYFKALYLPLLAVTGVAALPAVLLSAFFVGGVKDAFRDFPDDEGDLTDKQVLTLLGALAVVGSLYLLAMLVQYVVSSVLSVVVVRAAALGRPLTGGQAWKETRPYLWRAAGALALLFLPAVVLGVGPLVLVALAGGSLGMLGLGELFLWLVIGVATYATVRLALLIPVLVLEESTPVAAFRRAWQLNRGNWWRSLGLPALVSVIGRIAINLVSYPVTAVGAGVMVALLDPDNGGSVDNGELVVTLVLILVGLFLLLTALATAPLAPVANGLLYVDRRIRNERLDVALAEAAGIRLGEPAGYPGYPGYPGYAGYPGYPSAAGYPTPGGYAAPTAPPAPTAPSAPPTPTDAAPAAPTPPAAPTVPGQASAPAADGPSEKSAPAAGEDRSDS